MNEYIYNLLRDKGITQTEAAAALGIKQPSLFDKFRSKKRMKLSEIEILAALLGMPAEAILNASEARADGELSSSVSDEYVALTQRMDVLEGLLRNVLDRLDQLTKK